MDIEHYTKILGERVKELREEEKKKNKEQKKKGEGTQEYLEEKLGFSVTTLSRLENGKTVISLEYLIAVAEYFDVSIDYLLGRTERKKVSKIRSTPTESKNIVREEFETRNRSFDWNELGKTFNNNS